MRVLYAFSPAMNTLSFPTSPNCLQAGPAWPGIDATILIIRTYLTSAAALFLILSITNYLLILFPPRQRMGLHWTTFLLPFPTVLLPTITLIVDLLIKASLGRKDDITEVSSLPAFWLSSVAVVSAMGWAGVVWWIRLLALRRPSEEEEEDRPGWGTWAKTTFWPWGR